MGILNRVGHLGENPNTYIIESINPITGITSDLVIQKAFETSVSSVDKILTGKDENSISKKLEEYNFVGNINHIILELSKFNLTSIEEYSILKNNGFNDNKILDVIRVRAIITGNDGIFDYILSNYTLLNQKTGKDGDLELLSTGKKGTKRVGLSSDFNPDYKQPVYKNNDSL